MQKEPALCEFVCEGLEEGKQQAIKRNYKVVEKVIYLEVTKRTPNRHIVVPTTKASDIFNSYLCEILRGHF